MTTDREYLRAGDIAQLTGVSLRTARRWIATEILASRKLGGVRLVAKRELERLLSPCRELDNDWNDEPTGIAAYWEGELKPSEHTWRHRGGATVRGEAARHDSFRISLHSRWTRLGLTASGQR